MSDLKLREFLNRITIDRSLREDLTRAVTEREDKEAAAAEVAREYGFRVDIEELSRLMGSTPTGPDGELADEELETVAGGLAFFQALNFAPPMTG